MHYLQLFKLTNMSKSLLPQVFLLFFTTMCYSQTIYGKWYSFDEKTNKKESIIEIYEEHGIAHAKIIKILNKDRVDATCESCEGPKKNMPVLGMNILKGLTKKNKSWIEGEILDPKNGKEYKCYLKLLDKNTLKVRGYIGISLLGRTAIWKRVDEI